jgi:hypothetical protein
MWRAINKHLALFLYSCKDLGQKVYVGETLSGLCTFISRKQNAGKSFSVKVANKYFEIIARFICFGTRVINQNTMPEESWSRLNYLSAC